MIVLENRGSTGLYPEDRFRGALSSIASLKDGVVRVIEYSLD